MGVAVIQRHILCPGGDVVEVDLAALADDDLLDEVARSNGLAIDEAVRRGLHRA
jgi:hypothetical protein